MSLHDDLTDFALLQADLARPFVDRDAVLARAGVDEAALRRAQKSWSERLAAEEAGPLRETYAAVFARGAPASTPKVAGPEVMVLHETEELPGPAPTRVVPSYLQLDAREVAAAAPPARLEMPSGRAPTDVEVTLAPILKDEPTLPFAKAQPGVVPAAVTALRGSASAAPVPAAESAEETMWIVSSPEPKPATPFARSLGEPAMPLEKYALFLALFGGHKTPAEADALRAQFGIASSAAQQELGKHFAARFEADPNERRRFDAIVKQMKGGHR